MMMMLAVVGAMMMVVVTAQQPPELGALSGGGDEPSSDSGPILGAISGGEEEGTSDADADADGSEAAPAMSSGEEQIAGCYNFTTHTCDCDVEKNACKANAGLYTEQCNCSGNQTQAANQTEADSSKPASSGLEPLLGAISGGAGGDIPAVWPPPSTKPASPAAAPVSEPALGAVSGGGSNTEATAAIPAIWPPPSTKPALGAISGGTGGRSEMPAPKLPSTPAIWPPPASSTTGGGFSGYQPYQSALGSISGGQSGFSRYQPGLGAISGGGARGRQQARRPAMPSLYGLQQSAFMPSSPAGQARRFMWNGAYSMGFTATIKEGSKLLQGFGPGLVPLTDDGDLRRKFFSRSNITYPILVSVGSLKNGSRAGTVSVGVKDLMTKIESMPKDAAGALLSSGALPINPMETPAEDMPDTVSFQLVCGPQSYWMNVMKGEESCVPKTGSIQKQLLPEFTFFAAMICGGMSPAEAWGRQCRSWSNGPLATGQNCMWTPAKNVTIGDAEKGMAKVVQAETHLSMLLHPMSTSNAIQSAVPLMMSAKMDMVEEFLYSPSDSDKSFDLVSGGRRLLQQLGAISGGSDEDEDDEDDEDERADTKESDTAGLKVALGAISSSGGSSASQPQEASQEASASTSDTMGIILERMLETALIPHEPIQLTRSQGQQYVDIC